MAKRFLVNKTGLLILLSLKSPKALLRHFVVRTADTNHVSHLEALTEALTEALFTEFSLESF